MNILAAIKNILKAFFCLLVPLSASEYHADMKKGALCGYIGYEGYRLHIFLRQQNKTQYRFQPTACILSLAKGIIKDLRDPEDSLFSNSSEGCKKYLSSFSQLCGQRPLMANHQ